MNYGCKIFDASEYNYFQCANRIDQKDNLFSNPPVPKETTIATAYYYNTDLMYDETTIYCGKFNFTYEDFYDTSFYHGRELCELVNGERISIQRLFYDLQMDFSFRYTQKMNAL